VSTFTVKADVHRTDNSDIEPMRKLKSNEKYLNKKCPKSELDLSTMDDIHVIESENLLSLQPIRQDKQKREKPRWSLRIKLHSSEDNDSLYGNIIQLPLYMYISFIYIYIYIYIYMYI